MKLLRNIEISTRLPAVLVAFLAFLPATTKAEMEVVVSPRITVVEQEGITGGGCPVVVGDRVLSFYANHPDDFGGSTGTATAISTNGGETWGKPKVLSFAGKLPTLHRLQDGVLTLTTALSRNHCRLYLSADGTGRKWSRAFVISSLTGGNVGAAVVGPNRLILTSPANRRIDAWHLRVSPEPLPADNLESPTYLTFTKGTLTWKASPDAAAYRVTPILIKPGSLWPTTQIQPCAAIETPRDKCSLNLRRQLLPGSIYAFEVEAVDAKGRVSPAARSLDIHLQ